MIRNLSDNDKINYIVIGIFIGIGFGFLFAMWLVALDMPWLD